MWNTVLFTSFLALTSALPQVPNEKTPHECGRIPDSEVSSSGEPGPKHMLPWYAAIYSKKYSPYMQICGGSLVTTKAVISAAQCFSTDEGLKPAEDYAVALGKVSRPWRKAEDRVHLSNVTKINIPTRYSGVLTNYMYDIAVVILEKEVVYQNNIHPVCLNFDLKHLETGKLGKVAGWGIQQNGKLNTVLQVVDVPYKAYDQCYNESPMEFREFITADKICAGTMNGTIPCRGDSGSGLAFPETDLGVPKYYLRGIVSVGLSDPIQQCPGSTLYTSINHHEDFLKTLL